MLKDQASTKAGAVKFGAVGLVPNAVDTHHQANTAADWLDAAILDIGEFAFFGIRQPHCIVQCRPMAEPELI